MTLDEKQKNMLEECGRCQMTIANTAIVIKIPLADLEKEMINKTSEAFECYMRGRLKMEIEVRKSINDMAKQGSTQAQELWLKLRQELLIAEA